MNATSEPNILALDAAGSACSAALWTGGRVTRRRWELMERGHAQALMPMVEEVVAGSGFGDLDLVAVSVGPGAYTGLRIAIAAARGLGLALGRPVIGIGSFDVHRHMAREAGISGPLAILLETKRADFYLQIFDSDEVPVDSPQVAAADEVVRRLATHGGVTLAGDAVERFAATAALHREECDGALVQAADAAAVAALAAGLDPAGLADVKPPRPMYLRAPDTSPPGADRQRLRG